MAKKDTVYFCNNCGYESKKWLGQCPDCKEWNTFVEEQQLNVANNPKTLEEIDVNTDERIKTDINELDNCLGGGIVKGSLTLIGGAPGIGKSTLLLQVAKKLGDKNKKVLYVSGEENLSQIKLRANRLGKINNNVLFLDETNLQKIIKTVLSEKPDLLIIDSIQTMISDNVDKIPGSISEIKNCSNIIFRLAKENDISTFLIGHITKEGLVAGPKILEHIVDTVLYFEDDNANNLRLLRCNKNRFGSSKELAVFEMTKEGLNEVVNPSEVFLEGRPSNASGCVVTCTLDSNRPIFLEVQSLVTKSNLGVPRRTANGFDYNRLNLIIAIIEKRLEIPLYQFDIYLNITGGLNIKDPSIDFAIMMAIISSYKDKALGNDCVYCGEVGLSGELRSIPNVNARIKEAIKLGYKRFFLPSVNYKNIDKKIIEEEKIIIKSKKA
jgi:DNA repair protein RadA/Sms